MATAHLDPAELARVLDNVIHFAGRNQYRFVRLTVSPEGLQVDATDGWTAGRESLTDVEPEGWAVAILTTEDAKALAKHAREGQYQPGTRRKAKGARVELGVTTTVVNANATNDSDPLLLRAVDDDHATKLFEMLDDGLADWSRAEEPGLEVPEFVAFHADYLSRFGKLRVPGDPRLELHIRDAHEPVLVRLDTFVGAIMPLRDEPL